MRKGPYGRRYGVRDSRGCMWCVHSVRALESGFIVQENRRQGRHHGPKGMPSYLYAGKAGRSHGEDTAYCTGVRFTTLYPDLSLKCTPGLLYSIDYSTLLTGSISSFPPSVLATAAAQTLPTAYSTAPKHPADPCPRAAPATHRRPSRHGSACPRRRTSPRQSPYHRLQ